MSTPTLAGGIPGDPALVEQGAGSIRTAGGRVQAAGADVRRHADAVVARWSGTTADAAHEKLRRYATSADAAGEGIAGAGPVLTTYAAALRKAQEDYAAALAKGLAAEQARGGIAATRAALPPLGQRGPGEQQIASRLDEEDAAATEDASAASDAMSSAQEAEATANRIAADAIGDLVTAIDEGTALTSGGAALGGAEGEAGGGGDEPVVVEEYAVEDAYGAGILVAAGGYGESTRTVEYSDGSYDLITGTSGEGGASFGVGLRETTTGIPGLPATALGPSASAALVAGGSTQELRHFGSKAEMLVHQKRGQTVLTKAAGVVDGRVVAPISDTLLLAGHEHDLFGLSAAGLLGDPHPPDAYVVTSRLHLDGAALVDGQPSPTGSLSADASGSLAGELETRLNRDGSAALTVHGTPLASAVASTAAGTGGGGSVVANPALTLNLKRGGKPESLTASYEGTSLPAEDGPGGRSSGSVTEHSATWDAAGPAGAGMFDALTSAAGGATGNPPYGGPLSLGPPDETSSSHWTVDSTESTGVDASLAIVGRAGFGSATHSASTRTLESPEVSP